jgi:hypothetical protein
MNANPESESSFVVCIWQIPYRDVVDLIASPSDFPSSDSDRVRGSLHDSLRRSARIPLPVTDRP